MINTLVDVRTWCSPDFLLPIGLHGFDGIQANLLLCCGMAGKSTKLLTRKPVDLTAALVRDGNTCSLRVLFLNGRFTA
ncbi:MAG: hypothetical protein QN189_06805 [Armatimonadota bacterium]|nr:hypothetical protein [Armatimonadota bacterium]